MGKLDLLRDYNATAHLYDERYKEEQVPKISFLLGKLKPKEKDVLLDVGCGTGLLFEKVNCGLIVGVDISLNMLREAKKRAKGVVRPCAGVTEVGAETEVEGGAEIKAEVLGKAMGGESSESQQNPVGGIKGNVELILADAEFLPIRGGSVDIVVSVTALQLTGGQEKAISEILRVLKDQGSFGISIIKKANLPNGLPKGTEIYDLDGMKDFFCVGKKGSL
ncbi:MAG: class I SAM-dependent methyltransferase [Candidatus Methanomethylicia archaeon]|jgi:ubiquinone/menaquinone biosynthesis C-methylase UbiE|nr:class I SAM-dependent methyltransferase [Candidatus Methanomethylicia archaeon]